MNHNLAPHYLQERVALNNGVVGIMTWHGVNHNQAGVLMLHGFASHKDEVGDLFKHLALMLTHVEVASLRIDFRGWGESSGKMSETTIDRQLEDAQIAYEYLRSHLQFDPQRLGALGFSLGGGIAILAAGKNPLWFKTLVTWSCIGALKETFQATLGDEIIKRGLSEEEIEIDLGWRKIRLKKSFFKSLDRHDPLETIRSFPGSFLAIAGSNDHSAKYIGSYFRNAPGIKKGKEIIIDADHIFNALDSDQDNAQHLLDKTIDWFKGSL